MKRQDEASGRMERIAATLGRQARTRKGRLARTRPLPSLWLLTDPARTPDPVAASWRLPAGAAVVFRAFGAPDAARIARALRRSTRERGLKLIIGADWRLAAAVGADGVHLPQRAMQWAPRLRRAHPDWLITAAAHDRASIVAGGRFGLDALLVSVVFASLSPSVTGRPLGPIRFAAWVRGARTPVIALGGVNARTAARLSMSGASGLAAVDGFAVRT